MLNLFTATQTCSFKKPQRNDYRTEAPVADIIMTRHVVNPDGWQDYPLSKPHQFSLVVNRRGLGRDSDGPVEWSVSEFGSPGIGFTSTGKRVPLSRFERKRVELQGGVIADRSDAFFSESEAIWLATDIVDGRLAAEGYRPLAVAVPELASSDETPDDRPRGDGQNN